MACRLRGFLFFSCQLEQSWNQKTPQRNPRCKNAILSLLTPMNHEKVPGEKVPAGAAKARRKHPALTLAKMLKVSGSGIALALGIKDQALREMQLTADAQRAPRDVEPEVSRNLVEHWGLNPLDFWLKRRLSSLIQYHVDQAWFVIWDSTADEYPELQSDGWQQANSYRWRFWIAARCELSKLRYLWLQDQIMLTALDVAASREGLAGSTFDSREFPLESVFWALTSNTPLKETALYTQVCAELREAVSGEQISWRRIGPDPTSAMRLRTICNELEMVEKICWDLPIKQTRGARLGRTSETTLPRNPAAL